MSYYNVICRQTWLRPDENAQLLGPQYRGEPCSALDSLSLRSTELFGSSPGNKFHIRFPRSLVKRDIHLVPPRNLSSTCSFLCAANVYCIHSWCQALCQVREDRRMCQSIGRCSSGGLCGLCRDGEKGSCPFFTEVGVQRGRGAVARKSPLRKPFSGSCPTLSSLELSESLQFAFGGGVGEGIGHFCPAGHI